MFVVRNFGNKNSKKTFPCKFYLIICMNRIKIKNALTFKPGKEVTICGWVRSFRANRFVAMNDGSCLANIQVVIDYENLPETVLNEISVGAAISVTGIIEASQGRGQSIEIAANEIILIGTANP